jgi:uncharacterized spore protein YtfJ
MTEPTRDADVLAGLREIIGQADAATVFGTPVAQDGTIVLPVAKVSGGGGGGGGTGPADEQPAATGTGGGFGLSAKALGVFVLRDGRVTWRPAVDVNKIVLGGQLVAVVALLVVRSVLRSRTGRAGE